MKNYKGVNFHKRTNKWRASICHKGERYDCGSWHESEREAALSRDKKILALNIPVDLQILKKKVVS